MSKEINLENNISTSVDEFEKFQSISMYEEDEYITLSDIVSSPQRNPDLTEILNDLPGDDDHVEIVENPKLVTEIPALSEVNQLLESTSQKSSPQTNQSALKIPKKRGRRKKNVPNEVLNQNIISKNISKSSAFMDKQKFLNTDSSLNYDMIIGEESEVEPVNVVSRKNNSTVHNTDSGLNYDVIIGEEIETEHSLVNINQQQISTGRNTDSDLNYDMIIGEETEVQSTTFNNSHEHKRTSLITNTDLNYHVVIGEDKDVPLSSINNSQEKKRRGRKPKTKTDICSKVSQAKKRCQNKNTGPNVQNQPAAITRGRKKKSLEASTSGENLDGKQNQANDIKKITKKKRKNFKEMGDLKEEENKIENINDNKDNLDIVDVEDVPLVAISNKDPVNVKTVDDINKGTEIDDGKQLNASMISSQVDSNPLLQKSAKRRGRPKKNKIQKLEISMNNDPEEVETAELSLSKLKDTSDNCKDPTSSNKDAKLQELSNQDNMQNISPNKRNSKKPVMDDYEYNIDSILKTEDNETINNSKEIPLTESSRPVRRKAKRNLQYDEGSDEDPFANVELSDDEPQKRKKGGRYNSDDEYFPGNKRPRSDTESDSEIGSDCNETISYKKGKSKKADTASQKSPKKRNKNTESFNLDNTSQLQDNVDFELNLETSVIKLNEDKSSNQHLHEFENFLAKMTEIKVKKAKSLGSEKAPFEIPTIDSTKEKKAIEVGSQTNRVKSTTIAVQTNTLYEVPPMKNQVPLSEEQSKKAIEFLSSNVKTTSELGQLMTQKSDDFIEKRINAKYVTDTFKVDYCVKKSFLLLKLAKHNLVQMEEDLAKQYEEFLKANNLIQHREEQKVIASTSKLQNSDSDCEIVEETVVKKPKGKPAFNPKTVFLNKELSIKIAKKSPTVSKPKEKLNVKGRHTVWINDSIMVKKVKPLQSFLAQDSRNKKPPDTYVTLEMVSDFFKMYERQKAISICAPHIETNWFHSEKLHICNYFFEKSSDRTETDHGTQREDILSEDSFTESEQNNVNDTKILSKPTITCPKTLLSICTRVINQYLYFNESVTKNESPCRISVDTNDNINFQKNIFEEQGFFQVYSLKTLCYKTITKLINVPNFSENKTKLVISDISKPSSSRICKMDISSENSFIEVNSLLTISLKQNNSRPYNCITKYQEEDIYHSVSLLKNVALERVKHIINANKFSHQEKNEKSNNNIVKSLSEICTDFICTNFIEANDNDLKQIICTNTFSHLEKNEKSNYNAVKSLSEICTNFISTIFTEANKNDLNHIICTNTFSNPHKNETSNYIAVKSLSEICTNYISMIFTETNQNDIYKDHALLNTKFFAKMSLKNVCFNKVTSLMKTHGYSPITDVDISLNFTIDNVNTISEDIFLEGCENNFEYINGNELYMDNDNNYSDNDLELPYEGTEDEENNWFSQVKMQELRSCVDPMNLIDSEKSQETLPADCLVNIKVEPHEDISENAIDSSTIKIEPEDEPEIMITPIDIITKQEHIIPATTESLRRESSNSYDVDAFEAFVSSNKMIQSIVNSEKEDIFSQSALRVRMQHEPDLNEDIDTLTDTMNLLIPQNIELAKDRLMESSSDEDARKQTGKVKVARRRGRPKKSKDVEPAKEKASTKNEVTMLTRKMRGRIRFEEKKKNSSESELEDITLNQVKEKDIAKTNDKHGKNNFSEQSQKEIQCNDVDSTENINENKPNISKKGLRKKQNKLTAESNKMIHADSADPECKQSTNSNDGLGVSSFIAHEPVELLQCTPSILSLVNCFIENESNTENTSDTPERNDAITYVERYGWNCYPINIKDTKIYQYATVFLEKLPESFVETYFKYQDVTERTLNDTEIDKLTNLQTLHRTHSKEKVRGKIKECRNINKSNSADVDLDNSLEAENCNELSPSEDEDNNIVDLELPLIVPGSSDNSLAKNILMNDDESDREDKEPKTKEEPDDDLKTRSVHSAQQKEHLENKGNLKEDLMLTADKMMNKELALLHAPVELNDAIKDVKDIDSKPSRSSHKYSTRGHGVKEKMKDDDDSSSEEEKQWFTTKEKLLKRLEKKQDTPSVDDAKRTKIVNEFIEKRSDNMETRRASRPRARRSNKKMLERRKQMKILSRELFGDESTHTGKKSSQTYSKGRRNIRKVIDKKLLARETVLANMEEFERKRRLTQKQGKLREVLGCEEGVNVVVINDELCLEYDFEQMCPAVTVHPFFTKVMKDHQYEGVKFMWNACFESVSQVSRGHKGGGCILAHCMGLGKTLQVLALLHTVLTHPHLGMRRVLVCCPLSTVLNWVDEINKWIGPVTDKIKVFELSKLKKTYERAYQLEDWYNGGGIFIIGYELFRSLTTLDPVIDCVRPTIINKIRKALLDPGPDIIICDEGHLLKNDCTVLAVAMSRVVTKRRIILTGTPMQNNLREYYCMVNFVKPNLLGTYAEYSNRFENPIMNGQHRDSREEDTKLMKARTHILHKVLEGCLQRQEASVLYPYLPKKHEYTVFITLTECQWDLYKHYLLNYAKASKQNVLKDFHVLQKIWTHPQVLHNFFVKNREDDKQSRIKVEKLEDDLAHEDLGASEDIKPNAMETWWLQYVADTGSLDSLQSSNKFLFIFRLLDECTALGDKVLIFSTSLYTMDALEYFLRRINNWSLGKDYYRLDGSVPAEVRQKWCREFNAPNNTTTKLFLISTRAGSLGLNMTAANRVIILDTSWNPAHDIQSIFRVYRFGQKKDCYIYRLVAMGTMEQKIYERSVTKQAVACRVVDEQQIDRHYNMSELSELYRFDDDDFGVSAGLAPGVHDAALLRVARGLAVQGEESKDVVLHAVHEHDSLLRGSGETNLPEHERAAAWMQFQQEHHTHNNIQNIAIKPKKDKKENNTKSDTQKIKQEQTKGPEKRYESRSKKGRKGVNAKFNIEQPSTSEQIYPQTLINMEQVIIRKIMSILIQHGFHLSKGPEEISQLVANVRNVVANFKTSGFNTDDPLVESIARVLLTGENIIDLPDPNNLIEPEQTILGTTLLDENADEMVKADEEMSLERKRRKQRRDSDEEYVPETTRRKKGNDKPSKRKSNENVLPVDNSVDVEINKSTLSDSLNGSYMQVTPDIPFEPQASTSKQMDVTEPTELVNVLKVEPKSKKDTKNNKKHKTSTKQEAVRESVTVQEIRKMFDKCAYNSGDSIVLSDDDEPFVATARSLENTTHESTSIENKSSNNIVKSPQDPPVPLHKSLLTNQHFINIVAQTYLSGNPMLDEDAAILAAQYSSFKALKEMEATKKDIVSGPIYDIAKKVLGMPLLVKLQDMFSRKKDTAEIMEGNKKDTAEIMEGNKKDTAEIMEGNKKDTAEIMEGNKKDTAEIMEGNKKDTAEIMEGNEKDTAEIMEGNEKDTAEIMEGNKKDTAEIMEGNKKDTAEIMEGNKKDTAEIMEGNEKDTAEIMEGNEKDTAEIMEGNKKDTAEIMEGNKKDTAEIMEGNKKDTAEIMEGNKKDTAEIMEGNENLEKSTPSTSYAMKSLQITKSVPDVQLNNASSNITKVAKVQSKILKKKAMPKIKKQLDLSAQNTISDDLAQIIDVDLVVSLSSSPSPTPDVVPVGMFKGSASIPTNAPPATVANNNLDDTICLDSDDEVVIIPDIPKAVKSTIKLPSLSLPHNPNSSEVPSGERPKLKNSLLKQKVPTTKTNAKISDVTSKLISDLSDPEAVSKVRKAIASNTSDIIRITEFGEIEVLRRFLSPEVAVSTVSDKTELISTSEEFITGDLNQYTPRTQQKYDDKIQSSVNSQEIVQKVEKLSKSTSQKKTYNLAKDSTEQKIGKSHSADINYEKKSDPLSVLQNVVQIPADKYDLTMSDLRATKEINNTKNVLPAHKIITVKSTFTKSSTKQFPTVRNIPKTVDTNTKLSNISGLVSTDLSKVENTAQPGSSKPVERVTPDQTDKQTEQKKQKKNIVKKAEWDKISGSSKDIVISKAGTLMKVKSKLDLTIDLTNTSDMASTTTSLKRPASWEDPSSKKKKQDIEQPMTLKDFNLDDIDDIIELE